MVKKNVCACCIVFCKIPKVKSSILLKYHQGKDPSSLHLTRQAHPQEAGYWTYILPRRFDLSVRTPNAVRAAGKAGFSFSESCVCEVPGASGKELGNYFRAPGFLHGDLAPSCRLLAGRPGLGAAVSPRKRSSRAGMTQGILSWYLLLN